MPGRLLGEEVLERDDGRSKLGRGAKYARCRSQGIGARGCESGASKSEKGRGSAASSGRCHRAYVLARQISSTRERVTRKVPGASSRMSESRKSIFIC